MTHNTQGAGKIKIVVGLGNPDPDLLHTYHNAGTLAILSLAARLAPDAPAPLTFKRYKDIFEYASAGRFIFVKPLVYMNESGEAVKTALRVLKAKPGEIAIVHDDSDLTIGNFKIAFGGGAAGHNGIRSIVTHLKTEDFTRIRIGIRNANEVRRKKAGDFVLSPITGADMKKLEAVFENIAEEILKEE